MKVYDYVRSFEAARRITALNHAHGVLTVERVLHVDFERVGNRFLTGHHSLALLAAWWYQFAHISVTLVALAGCYAIRPAIYRSARNALVATNLVGMIVFFVLPVMPPRLLPNGGYVDSVALAGFGTTHGGPVPADQYAAMPSLHLAWATWTAMVAASLLAGRPWRQLCYAYPIITGIVVVVTANHYVLDVMAGVGVAVATASASGLLRPRASRYPQATTSARPWIPTQMIRRRTRNAKTQAPGISGTQTVSSRYPRTTPIADGEETPTAMSPVARVTSSAPSPPGEGTMADSDDATR